MFSAPSPVNPRFVFSSLGGRYVLLAILPPPGPARKAALDLIGGHAALFADPGRLVFFGVLPDQASFDRARNAPPFHWFADVSAQIAATYRAVDDDGALVPQWILIDPTLRILATAPLAEGPAMLAQTAALPPPEAHAGVEVHAPVLIVPRILDPGLCRALIAYYERVGGDPSGVMREIGGKTVGVLDDFKKRRDATIRDTDLCVAIRQSVETRLLPEVKKALMFTATRMERYIVARYDAADGGYFKPHRDNTTPATAHRRFAVSINLNAEEHDGGDLCFPEFGQRTYRPPTGGAVVFSCALLHEATPVTKGTRFATLPFLYDEAGAELRQAYLDGVRAQAAEGVGA